MYAEPTGPRRWHWSLKVLHWVMAVLILMMIGLGWLMVTWRPNIQMAFSLYQLHKSIGVLIFTFLIIRIVMRIRYGAPPAPPGMPYIERFLASFVQTVLYGVMIAMPVTGWLMGSAAGFPTKPFGLFVLPDFIARNEALEAILKTSHKALSFILVAALILHIAGAAKHHFWDRDDVLRRMLSERVN